MVWIQKYVNKKEKIYKEKQWLCAPFAECKEITIYRNTVGIYTNILFSKSKWSDPLN